MKLNLFIYESERIEGGGYFNFGLKDYHTLEDFVDAGECEEIRLNSCINYIELPGIKTFLENLISRMAYGGTLYISSLDIHDLTKRIYFKQLTNDQNSDIISYANSLLFQGTANILSVEYLSKTLKEMGLKILQKRNNNDKCHIIAEFPDPTQVQ